MSYVELHCHSAYSFLDGASAPEELAPRAAELGYPALALTDHDGVWGAMEFAQACKAFGVRPIVGAELTVDAERRPRPVSSHASGRERDRMAESVPADHRGASRHAPAAGSRAPPPRLAARPRSSGVPRGWSASRGARATGRSRGRSSAPAAARLPSEAQAAEALGRRLAGAFGPDRFRVELQRPFWRHDRARNRWLAGLAERLGVRCVATGDVHMHDPSRAPLQDTLVAVRLKGTLEETEPERRGNASAYLARAGGDGRPLRRASRCGRGERADRRAARLRPDPRPRLSVPGLGGPRRRPDAGRDLRGPARSPVHGRARAPEGAAAAGGGAGGDPLPAAVGVLPAPLRHPRAGPRGGGRGPGAGLRAGAVAAGARAWLERQLDRLLPDRALARRPGAQRAVPGALLERGDHRGARHRSRLPARHSREADPPRPSALRRGALGAGRGVRLLPVARRDPRLRQGAWPAARRDRASGSDGRPVRPPRFGGVGHGCGDRRGARRVGALAGARPPGPRRVGAPAPSLSAPGRDGDLHQAAGRHLSRPAGGDGGASARPVGQGLVRGRRLLEDRSAGPGDAVGGRAHDRRDRPRARRGDRPLPDPHGRPGDLPDDPGGGHHRRLPDREPGADADAAADAAGEPRRPHGPGGAGAPGADPGRCRASLPGAPRAAAEGSLVPSSLRPPFAGADPSRHAGDDRLPGAGDPGGDGARRVQRRRGGGAAQGDEPQALRGGDPRLSRSVHRRGEGARGGAGGGGARLRADPRLLGVRVPEGTRGRLRPARLPVDLAAGPLRPRVPLLAAERAADGLLPARRAGPRGAEEGDRGAGGGRQPERRRVHGGDRIPAPRRAGGARARRPIPAAPFASAWVT